jgi:hypothetical protein
LASNANDLLEGSNAKDPLKLEQVEQVEKNSPFNNNSTLRGSKGIDKQKNS